MRIDNFLETAVLSLCMAVFSISCNKADKAGHWDEATSTFQLPAAGLSYHLPTPVEHWAIANPDNMPENIKFCGVDSQSGVCVMIIKLDERRYGAKAIGELSMQKLQKFVSEISKQPDAEAVEMAPLLIEDAEFLGKRAYSFRCDISLKNAEKEIDNMRVTYIGYVFGTDDGPYALVVTSAAETLRHIGIYTHGLKLRDEQAG